MNFQIILSNFREYLELKSDVYNPKEANVDYENISIFDYKDEFKDFLKTTYDYDMTKTAGMIEELKELQIVNGELVNPEDLSEEEKANIKSESIPVDQDKFDEQAAQLEAANSAEAAEAPGKIQNIKEAAPIDDEQEDIVPEDSLEKYGNTKGVNIEGADFVTAVLNEFLKDEDFRKAIDKNGDDKIDETDIEAFLDVIKCYDEAENNISLDDLMMAADDIQEGTFRYLTDEEIVDTISEYGPTDNAIEMGLPLTESGRNVTAGSVGTPQKLPIQKEDGSYIPENMSQDELKNAENDLNTKIENNNTELNEAIEDSEGKELKEAMNASLDEYNKAISEVDASLSEKIADVQSRIQEKEAAITANENSITEQNQIINTNTQKINECDAKISSLSNAKSSLQAAQSTKSETDKTDYTSQISQVESQIKQAEEAKKQAQEALNKAKEELQKLEENKETLNQNLNDLKAEMEGYEEQAASLEQTHPELASLRENYEAAKEKYNEHASNHANDVQTARDNLQQNQQQLNNIKQEIAKRESQKEASQYNPKSSVVEYAETFRGMSETQVEQKLGGVNFPNGLWCAAFVNSMLRGSLGEENVPDWYKNCNVNACRDVYGAANKNGCTFTDGTQAQAGDLIFFNTSRGSCCHIGIVKEVKDGIVYTIEGNTSSKVLDRKYQLNGGKIFGYARVA